MLGWIENSAIARFVQESLWGYPVILSAHAVGMAILAGIALMVNLRLLGFAPGVPTAPLRTMIRIGFWGLLINFVSGVMLFAADAYHFLHSWPFRVKLALLVTGVLCLVLVYRRLPEGDAASGGRRPMLPAFAVCAWLGVIVAGRLIAYL